MFFFKFKLVLVLLCYCLKYLVRGRDDFGADTVAWKEDEVLLHELIIPVVVTVYTRGWFFVQFENIGSIYYDNY